MAHQPKALKILAAGSPLSKLEPLVTKLRQINAKHGPFDACVLVGDVFADGSDGSELNGLTFPVPTYFTIGKLPLPEVIQEKIQQSGGEVAPNLLFLGKSSVLTTAQGLKIACVGGVYEKELYDMNSGDGPLSPIMSKPAIDGLLANPALNPPSSSEDSLASAKKTRVALPSAFTGVDILLVSSPPPSLSLYSTSFASLGFQLATPASPLSDVVVKARPRYMFWADGAGFWEREPFGWWDRNGKEERWTRAVKLGHFGVSPADGQQKPRWFYALTLPAQTPTTDPPTRPKGTAPNPYNPLPAPADPASSSNKRPVPVEAGQAGPSEKRSRADGPPGGDYVCKICNMPGHWIQDCPQKAKWDPNRPPPGYTCRICHGADHFVRDCPQKAHANRPPPDDYTCRACGAQGAHYIKNCHLVMDREKERSKRKQLGPEECWFCLSNPKVTKHLIVAIGQETYVTLPKGQLIPTTRAHITQAGQEPLVPGGGHVLIIPIAHHPTLLSIPADDAMNIIAEIESFKSSLRACYAKYDAVPVSFEIGRLQGKGGHAHVQIVPIPKAKADQVADAFRRDGERQGLDWETDPDDALARLGSTANYFKVECPDGTKLVHLLKGNFDLQFGRFALGNLLGMQHRIDWKECVETEAEEKEDAVKFKKAFAPFHGS